MTFSFKQKQWKLITFFSISFFAKSASTVVYTECTSSEGLDSPPHNKCLGYDTKQSVGGASVILELWEMHSTPSLPSLLGPFCPGVVPSDRILFFGQIELNCVITLN